MEACAPTHLSRHPQTRTSGSIPSPSHHAMAKGLLGGGLSTTHRGPKAVQPPWPGGWRRCPGGGNPAPSKGRPLVPLARFILLGWGSAGGSSIRHPGQGEPLLLQASGPVGRRAVVSRPRKAQALLSAPWARVGELISGKGPGTPQRKHSFALAGDPAGWNGTRCSA